MFGFISDDCTAWDVNTVSLIQNALYSWQVPEWSGFAVADIGYLFLYSVSSFLHPFLTHFDCLAFCGVSGGVMKGDNASSAEDIDFAFLVSCSLFQADGMCCLSFSFISPAFIFDPFLSFFSPQFLCQHFSFPFSQHFPLCSLPTHTICLSCSSSDPGAVVETHSAVPYAVIGGVLALLVFTVICVLIVTIWCSVRQKGNPPTHSNSHIRWHKSYSHKHTSHFWESGYFIKFPQACFLISQLSDLTRCENIIGF